MTLASYMIESGLTDGEMAARLGVSGEIVRLWRVGRRPIPARRAIEISNVTGISLHELRPDFWPPPKKRVKRATPESEPTPPSLAEAT